MSIKWLLRFAWWMIEDTADEAWYGALFIWHRIAFNWSAARANSEQE